MVSYFWRTMIILHKTICAISQLVEVFFFPFRINVCIQLYTKKRRTEKHQRFVYYYNNLMVSKNTNRNIKRLVYCWCGKYLFRYLVGKRLGTKYLFLLLFFFTIILLLLLLLHISYTYRPDVSQPASIAGFWHRRVFKRLIFGKYTY